MPNYDKIRHARHARILDEAERAIESYSVFLAGPYVSVSDPSSHPENSGSPAKKLRYDLYHRFSSEGHRIYLGEDVELRENGDKHYGPLNNAVVYERHYISRSIDALIILPSSPGSFSEFGDWASDEHICKKSLIMIDQAYENKTNYLNDGPARFAKSNGASLKYISYLDLEGAYEVSSEFLGIVAARKRVDRLYGRS